MLAAESLQDFDLLLDWSDASLVEGVTVEIDGILLEGAIIFDNGHACLCQLLKYLPNFVPVLGGSRGPDEEVIDVYKDVADAAQDMLSIFWNDCPLFSKPIGRRFKR